LQLDIDGPLVATAFDGLAGITLLQLDVGRVTLGLDDLARDTPVVMQALTAHGVTVRHLNSGRANLEDVFLALTGRQLRD